MNHVDLWKRKTRISLSIGYFSESNLLVATNLAISKKTRKRWPTLTIRSRRVTLIESAFQHLRKLEEETRKAEAQRRDQDRLEAAKRKEIRDAEKQQEEELRRARWLSFM